MTILVEYRCAACGVRTEHFVARPAPSTLECRLCGGDSRRSFATAGLISGRDGGRQTAPPSLDVSCRNNPDVPGLCHLTPAARERLVARARRDGRAEEAAVAKQERRLADGLPVQEVVAHDHGHGGHSHGAHGDHVHATPAAVASTPAPAAAAAT
ncbi:MAG: hypothetical protein AB7G36_12500 [Candidatus Nanopelagicales bacterium]